MTAPRQSVRFLNAPDGTRIACAESGNGPPLVKVANWLSHLEFEWDSPVWRHWLIELSHRYRLVRYDQRGCGLSDWGAQDVTFDAMLGDFEMVVDSRGLERVPLICISQGAALGIAYAAKHPERVAPPDPRRIRAISRMDAAARPQTSIASPIDPSAIDRATVNESGPSPTWPKGGMR